MRLGIELLEGADFQPLVSDDHPSLFPCEDLDPIAPAIEEEEEMFGQEVLPKAFLDQPESASKLFRMSVGSVQRNTRTAAGSWRTISRLLGGSH
jgi:hypothetical protein